MTRRKLTTIFITVLLSLAPLSALADLTVTYQGITPTGCTRINSTGQPINDSEPAEQLENGASLFTFVETSFGTGFTATFSVTEQPAAVVGTGAEFDGYTYTPGQNGGNGTITIVFDHVPLVGAPSYAANTFGLAFVPVETDQTDGPPEEMAGSWMSTNINPDFWQLIPPEEGDPDFGYKLSGPEGEQGFFEMFIPQAMIDLLSTAYGEQLTAEDLAVFNDGQQASLEVEAEEGGGAIISILVTFTKNNTEVEGNGDQEESNLTSAFDYPGGDYPGGDYPDGGDDGQTSSVSKDITVDRAKDVSLTANNTKVKKKKRVTLYGWVKDGTEGDKVKITSKLATAKAKLKGAKAIKKNKKKGWKRPTIDAQGYFSVKYKAKQTDVFKAFYKPSEGKQKKSNKLKVKVTKRGS